jgi:hypothetical protein
MDNRFHLFLLLYSLGILILVWQLIKKGQFRPAYALPWLFASILFIIISFFQGVLKALADLVQINNLHTFLISIGIVFIQVVMIHQTVVVSYFAKKNKELAQNYALLQWRLEKLEARVNAYTKVYEIEPNPAQDGLNPIEKTDVALIGENA